MTIRDKRVYYWAIFLSAVAGLVYFAPKILGGKSTPPPTMSDIAGYLVPKSIPVDHISRRPGIANPAMYPSDVGAGITSIMRDGWTPATVKPPTGYEWVVNPPSVQGL